jgi:hypothetical protein
MLRYLHILDDGLIDRVFQPASDWVHDWTGTDSIDQVQWSYRLSGFAWAGSCGWSMAHGETWAIDAFLAFASISISLYHSAEERSIRHYAQSGLRNSRRLRPATFLARIAFLFVFLLNAAIDHRFSWLNAVLATIVLRDYLYCCDSQGPGKAKFREWIGKLSVINKTVVPETGKLAEGHTGNTSWRRLPTQRVFATPT